MSQPEPAPPMPVEPPCLRPFLAWILARHAALGGLTELRILRKGDDPGIWSGWFGPEDLDRIAETLRPVQGAPREAIPRGDHPRSGEANIYFSLQAVQPERLEGRRGILARRRTTTRDRDVLAYTLFVVDVDPERNPRDSSASTAEKAKALEVATRVQVWLRERGAESMLADSGNGWHLLVPLRPAQGEGVARAARDARDLLRLLDRLFSTPSAKVDTTTYNPSRILKLYGTVAVKGAASAERPHRVASVSLGDVPQDLDLFATVAADLEASRAERKPGPPSSAPARTRAPARAGQGRPSRDDGAWKAWRSEALARLPLEAIYGPLLTGGPVRGGWLECRDPDSPTGDRSPSAGVADGSGEAERGTFHSFLGDRSESVFDFMLRRGLAADMREACARVAALSGVPVPEGGPPQAEPADLLADLEAGWAGAGEEARHRLLRAALTELAGLPADRREDALARLRAITGHSARVLREVLAELRRESQRDSQRQQAPPSPPPPPRAPGRPVVDYLTNGDTVAALFDAIVEAVAPTRRFFRSQGDVVFVRLGQGPVVVNERNLPGLLAALIELRFVRQSEDGPRFLRYGVLPAELARAFTCDPRIWSRLPELHLYCRSPVFLPGWAFVGEPGYHPAQGVFYDGPPVAPSQGSPDLLEQALRDFHWKDEADLVNFVGALLTALTIPLWGRGHPFLAINGNKPGVGKTTLARVLGVVVEGSEPSTVSYVPDEAEFEKQLATRVEAGDRVIVIDNAKTRKPIESPVLERCVTDSRLNFRRLGSNTSITRPQNDLLFCLTMNLTTLGADLRRRALPVNLHLEQDTRATCYQQDDVVGFVQERRLDIVAELAGMVQAWVDAGRPRCEAPARHSTSQAWAAAMDGILRLSGFDGFLANFDESTHAFDPQWEALLDAAQRFHAAGLVSAAEWAARLADGPLEDRFKDQRGNPRSSRARATIAGHLFRAYLGEILDLDGRRFALVAEYPRGPSHPPVYGFREVKP